MRILVLALSLIWSTGAFAAEWREAQTEHFRIISGGPEKDLRKFAERLEQFHALLGLATGINEGNKPKMRVRVYLVANEAEVRRLMGASGSNVAGFYRPEEGGAIAVVPRNTGGSSGTFTGQLVLFHEYAHHYMLQYTPAAYPAWYVEGFAELASTASFERKGAITFGKPASHRQYELENTSRYSPAAMVDGTYLKERDRNRSWSYGDAWLLTHYLTFSDERRGQLRKYLVEINRGADLPDAAAAFGDLGALRQDVGSYLRARSFPYRAVPLPEGADEAMVIRDLTPAEIDLVPFEIELARMTSLPDRASRQDDDEEEEGPKADADAEKDLADATAKRATWLEELAGVAARHGADPSGWRLLARARCESDDYSGCRDAADKALGLAPRDALAMAYKADAILTAARDIDDDDKREAEQALARDLVSQALAIDSDQPQVLLAHYQISDERGGLGLLSLIRAVQLVPQLSGPRLTLAHALVSNGSLREARNILRPLAYAPHGGSASEAARALLDKIEEQLEES